jgi:hypothetical protein
MNQNICSALFALAVSSAGFSEIIRVPDDQPDVAAAIAAASDGDEVHVAAGDWEIRNIAVDGLRVSIVGVGAGKTVLSGGGVARGFRVANGSVLDLRGLTVQDCVATSGGGGAALVESASLHINECAILNNRGGEHGGALFVSGPGEVLIYRSSFVGNAALHVPYGDGGAIFAGGGTRLVVESSLFRQNTAPYHAGAVAAFTPSRFNNCVFDGNSASIGGAVRTYHMGHLLTFTNCTFVDNGSSWGSAIFSYYGDVRLVNCALRGSDPLLVAVYEGGRFFGAGCVLASGTLEGYGNMTADPEIGSDYGLLPGSPCIDAGVPQLVASLWGAEPGSPNCSAMDIDFRGNPRWLDDPATPNNSCFVSRASIDVGAMEFGGTTVLPAILGDLDDDRSVGGMDLGILLGSWGAPDCAADLNVDGLVDSEDVALLLSNWGACP